MRRWGKTPGNSIVAILAIAVISVFALSGCEGPAGQQGPPGVGVSDALVNNAGHLIVTLSNGQTIDAGSVSAPQVISGGQSSGPSMTMGDLFSLIQPVIVRVDVTGPQFQGSGSGIIIRGDGYIITNEHVIDNATSITVTLNNDQQYPAKVTSSDTNIDLAILKLNSSPSDLSVATLGTSSDVMIGGVVIAAGFPLGTDLPGPASFTQGIISAIRTLGGQRYIQSDVQINPGNSGGALVARNSGRVIGITSAGVLPRGQDIEGIGLAIPIDVVQTYIQNNLK